MDVLLVDDDPLVDDELLLLDPMLLLFVVADWLFTEVLLLSALLWLAAEPLADWPLLLLLLVVWLIGDELADEEAACCWFT